MPAAIVARELDIRHHRYPLHQPATTIAPGAAQHPESAVDGDGARLADHRRSGRYRPHRPGVREMLPKAHFATVYAKPAGRPLVDTFITEVSQDTWILFPWDIEPQFIQPIAAAQVRAESGRCRSGGCGPSRRRRTRGRAALHFGRSAARSGVDSLDIVDLLKPAALSCRGPGALLASQPAGPPASAADGLAACRGRASAAARSFGAGRRCATTARGRRRRARSAPRRSRRGYRDRG